MGRYWKINGSGREPLGSYTTGVQKALVLGPKQRLAYHRGGGRTLGQPPKLKPEAAGAQMRTGGC